MYTRQKHCEFCGRFFIPDCRMRSRQRSCSRPSCRKARKKASQAAWAKKNPGYFKGRYDSTRQWREKHPDYQRQRRKKLREIQDTRTDVTARKSVRLLLPVKWFKDEIQDTTLTVTLIDSDTYVGAEMGVRYKTQLAKAFP